MNASDIINRYRLTALERNLNTYGVVVHLDGVDTEYRWRADDRECLYSASKTFTSVAIGIAQDEGRLSVNDKLLDLLPQYRPHASDGTENVTVRDLLHMAGGKSLDHPRESNPDLQCDWLERYVKQPLNTQPGTSHFYTNYCTYALSRVIHAVSGEDLRDYLVSRMFEPMGIYGVLWGKCPRGYTLGGTQLYLRTSELHKLGVLLLNGGVHKDKRIVSAAYVNAMHTDAISTASRSTAGRHGKVGYGYQVWRCDYVGEDGVHAYRADGLYGQYSIVVPDRKLVFTLTGHYEGEHDAIQSIFDAILNT